MSKETVACCTRGYPHVHRVGDVVGESFTNVTLVLDGRADGRWERDVVRSVAHCTFRATSSEARTAAGMVLMMRMGT